jgi:hypothetical protein
VISQEKLLVSLRQNGVGPEKNCADAILPKGHASPVSAGSLKPARLICSRILIDGRSSRKNRLGAIRMILLNRANGPSRNDGRILRRFVCPKE